MPAWLPDKGLLREHYEYGVWATDAPPVYHIASMATAMASVCADSARLVVDHHPFPLHVWSMLVGKSTSDRKTTSTRLAVSRVERAISSRVQRIYGSPEGIMQSLVTNPCIVLYVPEGGAFFAQREAGYWKHARDIFMDLYDYTEVFERRLVKDTFRIENPRISILAACAYPLLQRYTRDTDWLGGFLARFLMVSGERQPFKDRIRSDPKIEARIEGLITNVFDHDWGTMGCTTAARRVLDSFGREIHDGIDSYAPGLAPSLNRLPEMANRLSGLYEIAAHADSPPSGVLLVTADAAEGAVALCRASRDDALAQLGELTAAPGISRDLARVESIIRRAGIAGITRQNLIRAHRVKAQQLDELVGTLAQAALVECRAVSTRGRPSQKLVHVEARNDTLRAAANVQRNPSASVAWIDLSGEQDPDIGSLPAFEGAPPGATLCDDDDDPLMN
jgi:hypothetical protein